MYERRRNLLRDRGEIARRADHGRPARQSARQNRGDVTIWDSHLSPTRYACLPFFSPVWVCMVPLLFHSRRPTYACAQYRVPSRDRATEHTPESQHLVAPPRHWGRVLRMFAFSAMDTSHSPDSFFGSGNGSEFPWGTPNKVELKHFLESFQDAMDQKPYGAMLRGELPYAALQLALRNLDDIPPITDTGTREQAETGVKGCARSRLLEPHCLLLGYVDAANGRIETSKTTRYTRAATLPLDVRWTADVQGAERRTQQPPRRGRRRRTRLSDRTHARRAAARQLHGPGLRRQSQHPHQGPQPPHIGPLRWRRLGRLIIKFLPAALAGEGRALLRNLFDKNAL
eukprot:6213644-Pleurochrysis_carterae.AAC.9